VFVVGSGMVRLFKLAPNGKEHILHVVGPGRTFAEAAVIGGCACPATAEAMEDSDLALLPAESFLAFLRSDHQACIDLLAGMSTWLHNVVDLLEDVVLRDAAGRVSRHLLALADENGRVRLPAARRMLANQLNLTAETLSRTLRRLHEEGVITSEREAITVLDRERLAAVSDGQYPLM
jgi:CRP/FNR family transcriptional regulator